MPETTWDEVGQRFADLGRELQRTWQEGASSQQATSQLKDAGDKVRSALDEMAQTINQTAKSPEVHAAAREATMGLADALSATLGQVVDWMERVPGRGASSGSSDRPPPPDPDVDDVQDASKASDIQDAEIVDEGTGTDGDGRNGDGREGKAGDRPG